MKPVRPFTREDIPQVAEMFQCLLMSDSPPHRMLSTTALPDYFERIFFNNPWYDEELPSLVYQGSNGKVIGFLGVVPRRMSLRDRPVRAAISFHFMVEPESRSSLAGIQLLKAFFAGPQDLSLTDGAGAVGRKVWEGVGGTTALLYSLRWIRILRPTRFAVEALGNHTPLGRNKLFPPIARVLSPLCYLADAAATRMLSNGSPGVVSNYLEEGLDVETLLAHLPLFSSTEALRPTYDKYSLQWLLEHAAQMKLFGAFQKVLVRDSRQEVVGWYMYYLNSGGVSTVFQLAARKNSIGEILDHLFDHARRHGAIALSGRIVPRFMQELSEKQCFFRRDGAWTLIHSNNAELLHVIQRGDAFLTSLEGEWCLLF